MTCIRKWNTKLNFIWNAFRLFEFKNEELINGSILKLFNIWISFNLCFRYFYASLLILYNYTTNYHIKSCRNLMFVQATLISASNCFKTGNDTLKKFHSLFFRLISLRHIYYIFKYTQKYVVIKYYICKVF